MVSLSKAQPGELPSVDSYVHVETPENVWLSFRPAGPAPRLWAFLIDLSIRAGLILVLGILVAFLAPLQVVAGLPGAIMLLGYFVIEWFYGCLFEWLWRGRTPGKRAMKLKVVKTGGYPITFVDAFLRNLLRVADGLPLLYGVGLVVSLVNRRMQRLGDLVAGTFVVHEEREVVRGYPPWVFGVPVIPTAQRNAAYKPSDRTLDLVEVFLTRAQRLSRERADEIAHILAPPLAKRMGYQESQPHEVHQSPGWFLLRVLRTFVYPPSAQEQAAMEQGPQGPQGPEGISRPPGTTPPPWMLPSYTLPAPALGRPAAPGSVTPSGGPPSYGPPSGGPPSYGPPSGGPPSYGPSPSGGSAGGSAGGATEGSRPGAGPNGQWRPDGSDPRGGRTQ